jgi:hypothetical protein
LCADQPVGFIALRQQHSDISHWDAVVAGCPTLGSGPSAAAAAYSPCSCRDKLRAVTSLLLPVYDYAGSYDAMNPALYDLPRPQMSIGPRPPDNQESEPSGRKIHTRTTVNLSDDSKIYLFFCEHLAKDIEILIYSNKL